MRHFMMPLRRSVRWGGALSLVLVPALALGQDGKPPVGPPVTNPKTDKLEPREETSAPRPRTSADVLPPVPATAADPAPPGTRAVRVDVGRPAPATPAGPNRRPATRRVPGVLTAEGVVTRIDPPGKNIAGELIRFAFDPEQDWSSYISLGPAAAPPKEKQTEAKREETVRKSIGNSVDERTRKDVARKADQAAKEADKDNEEKADAGDLTAVPAPKDDETNTVRPNRSKPLEMVVTNRTYIFTHARTPEGADIYGAATQSSPDINSSRSGQTNRAVAPVQAPMPTNFTNIKEGSFVSVRYRRVGNLNEVLNLSLIEHPIAQPPNHVGEAPTPTGAASIPIPGVPSAAAIPGAPGTPAAPVRVPRVPKTPVSIGTLPR